MARGRARRCHSGASDPGRRSADDAPRVLRGFTKVGIATGASTTVTLPLTNRDLSAFDEDADDWRVVRGRFAVFVGESSRELTLTGTFTR